MEPQDFAQAAAGAVRAHLTAGAFRRRLIDTYDLDSLRTLCQDLDIRYDNLGGENTIEAKARELVNYCRRHGRMPDLQRVCAEQRPHAFSPPRPGEFAEPPDVTPAQSADLFSVLDAALGDEALWQVPRDALKEDRSSTAVVAMLAAFIQQKLADDPALAQQLQGVLAGEKAQTGDNIVINTRISGSTVHGGVNITGKKASET